MLTLNMSRFVGPKPYSTDVWKLASTPGTKMTLSGDISGVYILQLALNERLYTTTFLVRKHILRPQHNCCSFYD